MNTNRVVADAGSRQPWSWRTPHIFRREWEISALQHGLASTLIGVRFLLITKHLGSIFYWGHIKFDSNKNNTAERKILFFL
jgi:hypothetical protein